MNHYDLGREVQTSFFVRTSDGRKLNPTEAGDRFADSRIAVALRHQAPLVSARVDGARQQFRTAQIDTDHTAGRHFDHHTPFPMADEKPTYTRYRSRPKLFGRGSDNLNSTV